MTKSTTPELSVIIPCFNEGPNIELLHSRLIEVLSKITMNFELYFVDDGSKDDTMARIKVLCENDHRLRALSFSRNFGKEIALAAGLDHVRGRGVIIMDSDLQHPPEVIPEFVAKWREGFDMVYGVRRSRETDGALRKKLTHSFYDIFARFGDVPLPEGAGDFRLLDRKVVEALRKLPERARFSKGLYAWVGFKSAPVLFDVAERVHGSSKWGYRKLTRFAFDGLTSFSTLPLKISTYVGLIISLFSFAYALVFLFKTLVYGADVPGFPTLVVSVMFFSGIQLLSIGVIGEYVGRIFAEVKRRPLYLVSEEIN